MPLYIQSSLVAIATVSWCCKENLNIYLFLIELTGTLTSYFAVAVDQLGHSRAAMKISCIPLIQQYVRLCCPWVQDDAVLEYGQQQESTNLSAISNINNWPYGYGHVLVCLPLPKENYSHLISDWRNYFTTSVCGRKQPGWIKKCFERVCECNRMLGHHSNV